MIDIQDNKGNVVLSIPLNEGARGKFSLGSEDYVVLPFYVSEPVFLPLGSGVDLTRILDVSLGGKFSKRYEVVEPVSPTYANGCYQYDLRLDAYYMKWKNKVFKYIPEDGGQEASWSLVAALSVHLGIVLRNLSALGYTFNGDAFTYSLDDTVEDKTIFLTYSNVSIWDALVQLAESSDCDMWVTDNIIHFGRCEFGDYVDVEIGKQASSMTRSESQAAFVTRAYAFGSTKNLPPNYRPVTGDVVKTGIVEKRLMLPDGIPYIDAYRYRADGSRVYVGEDGYNTATPMPQAEAVEGIVTFDNVFPRTDFTVGNVDSYDSTVEDEDGTTHTEVFYYFTETSGIKFDESYVLEGEELKAQFKSGLLNGLEFGVTFRKAGTMLNNVELTSDVYEIVANDNYGRQLPDDTLFPQKGDKFVLLGWDSTKIESLGLVAKAELELKSETEKYVKKTVYNDGTFNTTLLSGWVYDDMASRMFSLGQRVTLHNKSLFRDGRKSRVIGFEIKLDIPYDEPVYEMGESGKYSRLGALESAVDAQGFYGKATTNGPGGTSVYVVRMNDNTAPSDFNVYSSSRARYEFLNKNVADRAKRKITFEEGIEIGGDKNGYIDGKANAELLTLIVRDLLKSPNFRDGFEGEGWRIWMEDALSHLTIDRLTVRQVMNVFEMLIMKVRSVGGQIAVSAANGKIKSVTRQGDIYFITFEDGCDFVQHDLMRCATWKGGKEQHAYWVEIAGVTAGVAWVLVSEFDGVEPMVGDECVLMGNTENPLRQNMILISATEDGKPRIDVMDGINKKSFEGCLRARLGNLDRIDDSWFPATNQPHGDGLYADNAYLRGTFLLSTGEDIKTKFEIVEGMISSAVESVRQDFAEGEGFLSNPLFADGFNYWSAESDTGFLTVGNSWIWANSGILSKQGDGAVLSVDRDRTVINIKNTSIVQKAADYSALPEIETNADGKKEPASVYLSFLYKVRKAGRLNVRFEGLDKTGFENFSPLAVEEALAETEDYRQYTCSGLWNGTGDFTLGFTGEISVCMIVLSTDRIEALTYTYKTLFEQSEKLVKIAAENFDEDGNILGGSQIVTKYDMNLITTGIYDDNGNLIEGAGLVTTPKGSGLFAFDNQGGLAQVGAYTEDGEGIILLKGDKIRLEGAITANGNVTIDKDGRITAVDGTFSGSITANSGKIGLFTIDNEGLYYGEQNKWYDGNYKQNLAYITPGAVRIQNEVGVFGEGDVANIKVAFGDYADPSLEVDDDGSPLFNFRGCSAGYIYRQSVSLPPYEYFPAVKIISDNAIGRDVALYTKGAIVCQGGLWGAACIMDVGTGSGEYNVIAPDKGSTILLRNPGGARLYMPKLAEMKRMMQTDGVFAVPLRLVSLNGNGITTMFFNDGESKTNFLLTTGDSRAFIQLSSCNTVDILLIYNGTDDFYAIVK